MSVFSRQQHFNDHWVGHPGLNRAGLHLVRLALATTCYQMRVALRHQSSQNALRHAFRKQGFVIVPNFLPATEFAALQTASRELATDIDQQQPFQSFGEQGFGNKHPFNGGFDRFDGATLNRFYQLPINQIAFNYFLQSLHLQQLVASITGTPFLAERCWLYKVRHGDEHNNPDIQQDWHRDTFQPAMKLWYFTEDVQNEHGPFEYIPGSHKLTLPRLRWEYQQSLLAAKHKAGGAFRIDEQQVCEMYHTQPIRCNVNANTLILADVRGFHRRSHGQPGAERLSFYANFRPHPLRCW